jgi:hypothetical protein
MDDPERTAHQHSLAIFTNTELRDELAQQWELSLQPGLCPEVCVSYLQNVKDIELEFGKRLRSALSVSRSGRSRKVRPLMFHRLYLVRSVKSRTLMARPP